MDVFGKVFKYIETPDSGNRGRCPYTISYGEYPDVEFNNAFIENIMAERRSLQVSLVALAINSDPPSDMKVLHTPNIHTR